MNKHQNPINRLPAVEIQTGLKKTTIYKLIKEGKFPKPINLSGRAVGWLQSDIDDFIATCVANSRNEKEVCA